MTGHIRRRGERSWEIKFELGTDPLTQKRLTRYHSFKGTKKDAEAELIRLKAAANKGEYVDPSKLSLGEFLNRWESWAAGQVSPKTYERYSELLKLYVRPRLGAARLQRLRAVNFAELYGDLQKPKGAGGAGLAPRTVGHVHCLLKRIMSHALKWSLTTSNPVASADPPPVQRPEVEILGPLQIKTIVQGLKTHPLYPIAVLGLATGMRRGELVALRWMDVDLDGGRIRVEQSLEQTKPSRAVSSSPSPDETSVAKSASRARAKPVLRFKTPKTKAGRRSITIPSSIVTELRTHWRRQQEERLALGLGKASDDDLVFARYDGSPYPPDSLTSDWARTVRLLRLPDVTFHALRHTHVSQLIASGLDVVTVSRRIGHSNPTTTLSVYAHLFGATDERAASVVEAAMADILA
jgi:integrase